MKAMLSVAAVAVSILSATPARAAVLTFEGVATDTAGYIVDGYGGVHWDNFAIIHRSARRGSGYDYGTISGDHTAYNTYGAPAAITLDSGTFTFGGGWFTSAWYNDNVLSIEGHADDDGIADYALLLDLDTRIPFYLDVHWTGLHSLFFSSTNIHFAMDDLRINVDATTAVPEPLAIGLLGMGLLGMNLLGMDRLGGASARRRRRV